MEKVKEQLRQSLALDFSYQERPIRRGGTSASVLILFGMQNGVLSILLVRRSKEVKTHQGQMAFPGGVSHFNELESPDGEIQTALRETWEEVGIASEQIEILGRLPKISTITNYCITPVVGTLKTSIENLVLKIDSREINEVVWIPLEILINSKTYREEHRRLGQDDYRIHIFEVGPYQIWGATGSMMRNLLDRWNSVQS